MTNDQSDPDYDWDQDHDYIYDVVLCVEHPTEPPGRITVGFALTPDDCRPSADTAGAIVWSHAIRVVGRRFFFVPVLDLLTRLEAAESYLQELIDGGGRVTIWLRLPGHTNIGDVLGARDVGRMARLRVELGVEVVPDLREEPADRVRPPRERHA